MRIREPRARSTAQPASLSGWCGVRGTGRLSVLLLLAVANFACGNTGLFRAYEYEEEVYLSLDGSATVYVNSSIAALNALRGTSFDQNPSARIDRDAVRQYFESSNTHVAPVRTSRRSGRRFVHLRLDVDDIRALNLTKPFSWSIYKLRRVDDEFVYEQAVGTSAAKEVGNVGWSGRELVAFRVHLPSKINYHNTGRDIGRGNILAWEQPLGERLHGVPLTLEARMQTQSILYRTLWLFAATFVAVAVMFVAIIWWVLRRGEAAQHAI
jgi:hypothetical protein